MGEILSLILFLIICFIISSTVHELGHIFMGLKEGFKFYLFIVGPIGIKRNNNDKIVFYIEKDVSLWGGLGATIPQNENGDNFKKFGRILLAGPITSVVFGVICLLLGIITKNIFLLIFSVIPIFMGIACLIPVRAGVFYTDGGRWLRMQKNESTKAVEIAIWNLTQNAIVHGNFVKANFDEIMVLINDKDLRTKYLGHYYAYHFYKDNNDISNLEKEKEVLESLKKKVPKQIISMLKI